MFKTRRILKYKRQIQLTVAIFLFLLIFSMRYSLPHFDYNFIIELLDDDEPGMEDNFCQLPKLNPFDPTILEYINRPPRLQCRKVQPDLTYVDYQGILQYNESEKLSLASYHVTNVVCHYRIFDRGPGYDDNSLHYDDFKLLEKPVKLSQDMVEVICSAKNITGETIKKFYWILHTHPSPRPQKMFAKPSEEQLSVLLVLIDSVSLSALKRTMPLTFDYITKKMNISMLEGFNKIGENTQPIMIPALTGKRLFTEQKNMRGEIEWFFGLQVRSDNLDLITKDFAAKGYVTVFNEDRPDLSIFNFNQFKGFTTKPTDYYYHSYWQAYQNQFEGAEKRTTFCMRNIPVGDIFVDITKRHLVSMNNHLQFIFTAFNYYSHEDDGSRLEHADEPYRKFWQEMLEGGYLNKTAVIFMSDHGHRFMPMRKTLVGLMEEMNPFLGVWFPEWFYKLHPRIRNSLISNQRRLISSFDIHETLKDILHANYNGEQRFKARGMSLLYDLPENRTCTQAGIPRQYCLCIKYEPLDPTSDYLQSAALTLENRLNEILVGYDDCHRIKHHHIVRAEKLVNFKTTKENIPKNIRLVIETEPNQAIFESLLEINHKNVWEVKSHIQRLNAYKNTAHCMKDQVKRKYCTCKQILE